MAAAVVAMPAPEPVPDLYEHPSLECVECLGCGEMIEIPYRAVLEAGREAVDVKRHPENRLLWLELMALDHRHCHEYHDVRRKVSQIVHLQDKLQTVGATLAQLEMQVARHPESRGVAANFRSLKKLHENLQYEFNYEAREARARAIRKPRRAAGCVTPIRRGGCARPSAGSC